MLKMPIVPLRLGVALASLHSLSCSNGNDAADTAGTGVDSVGDTANNTDTSANSDGNVDSGPESTTHPDTSSSSATDPESDTNGVSDDGTSSSTGDGSDSASDDGSDSNATDETSSDSSTDADTDTDTDTDSAVLRNDLGDADDFSTDAAIYLVREEWEDNYNIPGGAANFIHQETDEQFWVFTDAPNSDELIKARVVRMTTSAQFHVRADAPGETVYLGVRYKDNLPTVHGAQSIYAKQGQSWNELGRLGGEFDHQWKVAVLEVTPNVITPEDGEYIFRIGSGFWSEGLTGDLPIDRIEMAPEESLLEVEADDPGFYPASGDGNFPNLDSTSPWQSDGQPFFPIGVAAGWTGMSPSSWRDMSDAGFNTVLFYNWMDITEPYAAGPVWGELPSENHYGFSEFLDEALSADLKVIGVFQNDVKHSVVKDYFGGESEALAFIREVCETHRNHPALLAWSPVDEPDMSIIPEYYAPLEWTMALKQAIRRGDPDHPIYGLEMGWRKGAFGHFEDYADYKGFDVYPDFGASISSIAARADQLVEESGGDKPFISFLKAYSRTPAQAYMSYGEAYLALIHGTRGIFYWDYRGSGSIWDTLSAIATEVAALSEILLPPGSRLDVNGENGLCSNSDSPAVENALFENGSGDRFILSVNTSNTTRSGIQFNLDGIVAGTEIEVMFEDRTLIANNDGFSDDFTGYGRHVYVIPANRTRDELR